MSSISSKPSATLLAFALAAVGPLTAQSLSTPGLRAASDSVPANYANRVLVKLREGSGAVLDDGVLRSRADVDLATVASLFAAAASAERVITVPLATLDDWYARCCELEPAGPSRPGHLGLWFRLTTAASERDAFVTALSREPWVQEALAEPIPYTASTRHAAAATAAAMDIPPPTPLFTNLQTYIEPAPAGFGLRAVHRLVGGHGREVHAYHQEGEWHVDHEDLSKVNNNAFLNGPPGTFVFPHHGTGVMGILVADRNGWGVTGVAHRTELTLASWKVIGGVANTLAAAILDATPGDVFIVISQFQLFQVKPDDWVPAEYFQVNFDAVKTATLLGFHVFSPAGNGDSDLEHPRFNRRFDPGYRDSGAVLVGATEDQQTVRASFSNYGSRIDANAWGGDVATTGYGTLFWANGDERQWYTERYAGTSSATSIVVAGAIATLSAIRFQNETDLTPPQLRRRLRNHGLAIPGIGTRPDFTAILDREGLTDGLDLDVDSVEPGGQFTARMAGADGATFLLVFGTDLLRTELGLNRDFHLDPATAFSIGSFTLTGGSADYQVTVPNDPALVDMDFRFQGMAIDASAGPSFHVSNSCEIWIR